MRPKNLKTEIFLDSGDPTETKKVLGLLGFLDGQTTNPTLISKNPEAAARIARGEKFSRDEIFVFYQKVVREIATLIPEGSISVEVYADTSTTVQEMLTQGREMFSWIPNAHIKFPITKEGLIAAEQAVKEGLRINMTLCFTQEQAAAVYTATRGAKKGQVFVSPFVGRLDDRGENGMDLIKNILHMYKNGDGHVETLTASVRNLNHLLYAIQLGSDIITAPFAILKEWGEKNVPLPEDNYMYVAENLAHMSYKETALAKPPKDFSIEHELTDRGIDRFSRDWNQLIKL